MLSVEDYFSNTVSKDSITYNAGWCYGNAGIVRGLMKVSYYLNDNNNYQYYKKELLSIINQELDNYNLGFTYCVSWLCKCFVYTNFSI